MYNAQIQVQIIHESHEIENNTREKITRLLTAETTTHTPC